MASEPARPSQPPSPSVEASSPQVTHAFVSSVETLAATRASVRAAIARGSLPPRVTNAALDVANELLANAHQHGTAPVRLTVAVSRDTVRIEVSDGSQIQPRVLPYRAGLSERGLGLRLVQRLAADWGCEPTETGKTVWARVV